MYFFVLSRSYENKVLMLVLVQRDFDPYKKAARTYRYLPVALNLYRSILSRQHDHIL